VGLYSLELRERRERATALEFELGIPPSRSVDTAGRRTTTTYLADVLDRKALVGVLKRKALVGVLERE